VPANASEHAQRFSAPIPYREVRRGYNTMRALAAAIVAAAALASALEGPSGAVWVVVLAATVAADAVWRRSHGTSALPLLVVDVVATGGGLLAMGHTPSVEAAAFAYLVTASLLVLSMDRAAVVVVAAALLMVPIIGFAPEPADPGRSEAVLELLTIVALISVTAQLLVSTGKALHAAGESQAEALAAERRTGELKNEFVSMVSHELRTPLTSIAGFADTLRDHWDKLSRDEIIEFLTILRGEAGHLGNLVEDILVIPRLEAGQLRLDVTEMDLSSEAFATSQLVFQEGTKEFSIAIPGGVTILADPVRVKQVLRNLMENARKYGGDQVLVEGEPLGDLYQVVVSDNGPGVPETHREKIFEHFEQLTKGDSRSDTGVGLGLPIARRLVRAMGGDLWYESRFPIGARFCFTVPLGRIAADADHADESAVRPPTSIGPSPGGEGL
jgi:signal transduction histidine kinase